MEKTKEEVQFAIECSELNKAFSHLLPEQYAHLVVKEIKDFFDYKTHMFDRTKKTVVLGGKHDQ